MPRLLVYILCAAVLVRLVAYGVALNQIGEEGFIRGDSVGYVELATNLFNGTGFKSTIQGELVTEVFRTPGYPLLLAPFTLLPNSLIVYGVLLSVIVGILLPLLLYRVALPYAGTRGALLSAGLIALEPHAVMYSFVPQTEVPFMLFALGGFLAARTAYERTSPLLGILSGFLLGYAVLIRPGYMSIFLVVGVASAVYLLFRKDRRYVYVLVALAMMCALVAPWYVRNHAVTGVYALSGAGWRNVYTDYLSSMRSIQYGTPYHEEKNRLKEEALPRFGITRAEVNSPANSKILRDAALSEMWANKLLVVKLESMLLTSFFINDGYFYAFRQMGYVHDIPGTHISPTYQIISKGFGAVPLILEELARQKFVPLAGRIFTVLILLSAIAGFFLMKSPVRYLFAAAIVLTALSATAIGLGLDARMRVPVEPLLFIFASITVFFVWDRYRHVV